MSKNKNMVWAFVDTRNERLFEQGQKALGMARELASALGCGTAALLVDSSPEKGSECLDIDVAARSCVDHGADRVLVLAIEGPARADLYAAALCSLAKERTPCLVLFAITDLGREVAARSARLLDAGLIADAEGFVLEGGRLQLICPSWGGEMKAHNCFCDPDRTGFITVSHHVPRAEAAKGAPGEVERIDPGALTVPDGFKLLSSEPLPPEHMRLEEADKVVVGGAGLGSHEGFSLCRDLAAALGGEVGATRPAVLAHWASEKRLIGQTGKTVRPSLLFSIGASGAIQYTAGITGSDTIVAINRDASAPIFGLADLGVVADARTFLPVFTAKVKKTTMRQLADLLGGEGREGFGAKVKKLRESHKMTIEALAQSTGKDPEFIEQVEADEVTPSVSFLLALGRALGVDPSAFLHESEKEALRDDRARQFVTRTQNYSYQTLTPGAENEHLRAFMITIEPRQAHKPVAYKHEGEEFVYVMAGALELTLGGKVHHLKAGESQHFNSDVPHKLVSLSDEPTHCLVVLYTP